MFWITRRDISFVFVLFLSLLIRYFSDFFDISVFQKGALHYYLHLCSSCSSLTGWVPSGSWTVIYGLWLLVPNGMFYLVVEGRCCLLPLFSGAFALKHITQPNTHTQNLKGWFMEGRWHFLLHLVLALHKKTDLRWTEWVWKHTAKNDGNFCGVNYCVCLKSRSPWWAAFLLPVGSYT